MRRRSDGQAIAEFGLAFTVFFGIVFGVVDFGRAIYQFNGASQAAREIARVTSVYPGAAIGTSAQTQAVIQVQKRLIPNLKIDSITCVGINDVVQTPCNYSEDSVRVIVRAPFNALTPPLSLLPTWEMSASSTVYIQ